MNDPLKALLGRIDAFCARWNRAPSYVCKAACNNSHVYQNLRDGRTITFATAAKIDAWMTAFEEKRAAESEAA